MGEANLAFARGALEEALKMCMEIVRQGNVFEFVFLHSTFLSILTAKGTERDFTVNFYCIVINSKQNATVNYCLMFALAFSTRRSFVFNHFIFLQFTVDLSYYSSLRC